MVGWIGSFSGAALVAAIGVLVAACGGQSRSMADDEPGTGATGGSDASGGVGASGGAGGVGGTGAGSGGTGGTVALPIGCIVDGVRYDVGETFPAGDTCNTCTCNAPETVVCTRTACQTCESIAATWSADLLDAKRCNPGLDFQCTNLVSSGLQCGCSTFVNWSDERLNYTQLQWVSMGCGEGVTCGACPPAPVRGQCAAEGVMEGFCVDVYDEPPEP